MNGFSSGVHDRYSTEPEGNRRGLIAKKMTITAAVLLGLLVVQTSLASTQRVKLVIPTCT